MDLPDCPPGTEGYEDTVTEVPKKFDPEESNRAEREFNAHLSSLKIKLEDGTTRCMVERRGRDISRKFIYLCYPCAAVCSGEHILQEHISGRRHKTKLGAKNYWPVSIFEDHPYLKSGTENNKPFVNEYSLRKIAQEVELQDMSMVELDIKYSKYKNVECRIQKSLDALKAPVIGVEFLIEFSPEEDHHEPRYLCVLCSKQGHPRTIIHHMTCFWHRYSYLRRFFPKAASLITPYTGQIPYRDAVLLIISRLVQRIEDKYGRTKPFCIDSSEYDIHKDKINQWIIKGHHFSERDGETFEEVVDINLINVLKASGDKPIEIKPKKECSPPRVEPPTRPKQKIIRGRRPSSDLSLSDEDVSRRSPPRATRPLNRGPTVSRYPPRYDPYNDKRHGAFQTKYALRNPPEEKIEKPKPRNLEHKKKLAEDRRANVEESAKKTLLYHEKNPEKHPVYPEEWKKFWNKRYKEIQAEGKDPSKHDFKPEWIVYWTNRMRELHDEELQTNVNEIYRRLCLTPPNIRQQSPETLRKRSPQRPRTRSPHHLRSPVPPRRRSPAPSRRRSPGPPHRRSSPTSQPHKRSRSPLRHRSPARTRIELECVRRSESPLSRREVHTRNRNPEPGLQTVLISDDELNDDNLSPWNSDSLDSLGSLPEVKSPLPSQSRAGSTVSRKSKSSKGYGFQSSSRGPAPEDLGPADNVVATLRILVALEDYLGSLGPKIVELLSDALKMEKEKANSSELILDREEAVSLLETVKEKLKGAVQAGLVPDGAVQPVKTAIVRTAALLHEADRRPSANKPTNKPAVSTDSNKPQPLAVAGVGAVDKEQIAQQMAAALIAQGKTNVTAEELAQLVDAVVGMAEAKKREKVEERKTAPVPSAEPKDKRDTASKSASALQLLQSAYDDYDKNEKKAGKEATNKTPDAMDGLSDSDLETLLKNFNELSAEEQHSLIAYLKKLEAREPRRVERLREYVSAAAIAVPVQPQPEAQPEPEPETVPIDSDDDDYTVEEVFQSATLKVKEDQIRQEMEVVKKSLQEAQTTTVETDPKLTETVSFLDAKTMSSAANLLAMVQASIQASLAASTPAPDVTSAIAASDIHSIAAVVTTNTQPRSFGDLPEVPSEMPSQELFPTLESNTVPQNPINSPLGQIPNMSVQNLSKFTPQNRQSNFTQQNKFNTIPSLMQNFQPQNQSNFPSENQSNFPSQNQSNFQPQIQSNFPSENQSNFQSQNQSNFQPHNQSNFPSENQSNFPSQNQSNFQPHNQSNFQPHNQSNFPSENQTNFPSQNQSNFQPHNQSNFPSENQSNFPSQNQSNFGQNFRDVPSNEGQWDNRPQQTRVRPSLLRPQYGHDNSHFNNSNNFRGNFSGRPPASGGGGGANFGNNFKQNFRGRDAYRSRGRGGYF